MYIHVDHRWFKTILKKSFSVFLIYSIFFTTSANATVGGWTLGSPIVQGASSVYTGTKNIIINGADYVKKGTAIVTPTATQVSKVLVRGVAGYALSVAVEQLLGSVDWVLDPANNQIKYSNKADPATCSGYRDMSTAKLFCSAADFVNSHKDKNRWYSAVVTSVNVRGQYADIYFCFKPDSSYASCIESMATTQVVNGTDETQEQTIPLDVVAAQVVSNAESGDAAAKVATTAAAADIVAEAEADQTGVKARPIVNQLENSSTTKPVDEAAADKANEATGEQTKNPDKPDTTDLKLTFPIFCNWAPTVCEAAQTVISFPKTLTNWWETGKEKAEGWATSISQSWTEAKEWAKDDKNPDDIDNDPPEIKQIDIGALDTSTFKGTPGCPAPIPVPVDFGSRGSIEVSYEPICQLASKWSFVAPLIGFISGAMIIIGVGRKGEDGEI